MDLDAREHYDKLIDEGNDPFRDPKPLRDYMDKWDGQSFIDALALDKTKSVLEIGVGTGRLAAKVIPECGSFCGIDISPKTIERATENLGVKGDVTLICGDFLSYDFGCNVRFDVIYSSLTFMHIKGEDKQATVDKVRSLLLDGGLFVLSIDKDRSDYIDMGTRRVRIYPDTPERIREYITRAEMKLKCEFETEFAHVFVGGKIKKEFVGG